MAKRIAYDTPAPKPQCQDSLRTDFYLYFLRRPDKIDPLDLSKGQPFYVGKGCNGRVGGHRVEARSLLHKPGRKSHKINIIHKLWKQGLDFQEDIILNCLSDDDAIALEIAAIEQYGRKDNGTGILANLTDGGEGVSGRLGLIMTSEAKERMRVAKLGKKLPPFSEGHKEKIRQANLRENLSPETLEKRSKAHLGKKLTPEHVEKMRQTLKGRKRSPEAVEKTRQANLGRPCSPEKKEKLRQANLGKKHSPERIERNRQIQLIVQNTPEAIERNRQAHLGKRHTPETKEKLRQIQLLRRQREREARNGSQ